MAAAAAHIASVVGSREPHFDNTAAQMPFFFLYSMGPQSTNNAMHN